ncbi:MAG: hypothetical protein FJY98_00080 [Candidatus Liptonbacteria bacterium]|nr:hypothetical protein [Candidatus Liptonbacteria bacterium]
MRTKNGFAPVSNLFDWLFIEFSTVWVAGVFVDGWAHIHILDTLDSFFTPWHALIYTGIALIALLLFVQALLNRKKGYPWRRSLPREYMFAAAGLIFVAVGGPGDMIWHTLFGIEEGVEALLSPTHILLAIGGAMTVGGPLHAIWYRDRQLPTIHKIPVILSFAYILMALGFMLQFLHPFNFPWMAESFLRANPIDANYGVGLGIANTIVFTGIFMGLLLASVRHWVFPFGSFAAILGLNALALTLMHGEYYFFISSAIVGGLFIDCLYKSLCSLELKEKHIRFFGILAPVALFTTYAASILIMDMSPWSMHMWGGMVVIAGITGYLLTYLVIPPGDGKPRPRVKTVEV